MGKLVTSMHGCGEPSNWNIFIWGTCKGTRMATNAFAFVTHVYFGDFELVYDYCANIVMMMTRKMFSLLYRRFH